MHSVLRLASLVGAAALALAPLVAQAQPAPPTCATYSLIGGPVGAPGDTNGTYGLTPGQTVTITLIAGTATSAVWNIVGDSGGVPVLAGPGGLGSTLTYTVPLGPPAGVGYYITSIDGTGTIVASCVQGEVPAIPALDSRMLPLLAALLAGAAWLARRRLMRG